jgi:ParB family chromosome partitioning protein
MNTPTQFIRSDLIDDPKNPMRSGLDNETLFVLAESIKREGLINPITVRPVGDRFEIVAGHRRFAACKIAGKIEIECVVRELSDEQSFEIMAHENLERQDVDPVDEALFIGRLIGENESEIKNVAEKLGRSVQWVEDRLAILTYPDYLVQALRAGSIKLGVAKHLGAILDDQYRFNFVTSAIRDGMSVIQAQYLLNQWKGGLFKPSDVMLKESGEVEGQPVVRAKAICARCGKVAIDPNLESVFIHKECPIDEQNNK